MGRDGWHADFNSELSGLRAGDLDSAESLHSLLSDWCGSEFHSRAIVGSAKVSWVLDIQHDWYLFPGFLSHLDTHLRTVNALQTLLNDWWESGRRTLISLGRFCLDSLWESYREDSSRSSLDFRDIYVATVLFLGAYVWIKFREVAFRGVHPRTVPCKQGGTKVVYDARLTPPMWDGETVPRLELGRFATPQEARNKFLIAAFYYNRDAGLLDGWFQVPPMSEEERRRIRTGLELRAWVLGQAKEVYKDFKKRQEAALVQALYEACEGQATEERDEVSLDPCGASLLNSTEHQQPALASQVENSGMGMAMLDSHGLECASHSVDGMHEGLALSDGHSLGSPEGSALPVSQLPPNTESGVILNGNDQLDILQTLVGTLQQQISLLQQQSSLQHQQFSDQQQQITLQQRQIQELGAQNLQLQHQQCIQQQHLQESMIQYPQWPRQFCLQQQQLQVINQGVPSFEVEMEQSMQEHNYSGLMAPPPDGGEV